MPEDRSVAIALQADLEIREPKIPYPIHLKAPELFQTNAKTFETGPAEVFSTLLPSDPGLKIELRKTTLQEVQTVRQTIFGQPFRDPTDYPPASVATSGTHDTETLRAWWESAPIEERRRREQC